MMRMDCNVCMSIHCPCIAYLGFFIALILRILCWLHITHATFLEACQLIEAALTERLSFTLRSVYILLSVCMIHHRPSHPSSDFYLWFYQTAYDREAFFSWWTLSTLKTRTRQKCRFLSTHYHCRVIVTCELCRRFVWCGALWLCGLCVYNDIMYDVYVRRAIRVRIVVDVRHFNIGISWESIMLCEFFTMLTCRRLGVVCEAISFS